MKTPQAYHGREQAYIKHIVLSQYLEVMFKIIGGTFSSVAYVDCFAGPWMNQDPGLQDTSVGLALNAMTLAHDWLKERGKTPQFRALFIEKE